MKIIENVETWKLIMSVLEEISNYIVDEANDTNHTIQMCDSLAEYTYKRDIETGLYSELKLRKKESEGDIFSTNLLVRLERHFFY